MGGVVGRHRKGVGKWVVSVNGEGGGGRVGLRGV